MNSLVRINSKKCQPIFVVGNSRSGTTMMGRILGRSETVFTFHELHFFEQLWSPESEKEVLSGKNAAILFARLLSIQREGYLAKKTPKVFEKEADKILDDVGLDNLKPSEVFKLFLQYEAGQNGKLATCDQTPRNVLYIEEILHLYPDAKFINMVRDPRDVLLSQKKKWRRRFLGANNIPLKEAFRSWVNYHPITISKIWHSSITASIKFSDSQQIMTVFFEKLLQEPESVVQNICAFLDISFEKRLIDIPQVGSSIKTDQSDKTGINPGKAGVWRNKKKLSETELFWCQKINGSLMDNLGYVQANIAPNRFAVLGSTIIFPLHLALALMLNLNRMKNIVSAIKKRLQ